MERFKSTLGTTATIVLGLVLAAHLKNGGNEEPARTPRPAVATVGTWTDPPAGFRQASREPMGTAPVAISAVVAPVLPGSVAAILPAEMAASAQPPEAAATHKLGAARHTSRVREASADGRGDTRSMSPSDPVRPAVDDDPIGALIRDLDAARRS